MSTRSRRIGDRSGPLLDGDALVASLNKTKDWPKMALLFSRAIATIRSNERERLVMLARIDTLERQVNFLDRAIRAALRCDAEKQPGAA